MSKVRLQCLDIRCHEEVGMETNPNLCTHLHTPRTPATGRQSWRSLSSLHPPGGGALHSGHFSPLSLPPPDVIEGPRWTPLRSGSLGLTAGGPWTQTHAGAAFPAASMPWAPGTDTQSPAAPALFALNEMS